MSGALRAAIAYFRAWVAYDQKYPSKFNANLASHRREALCALIALREREYPSPIPEEELSAMAGLPVYIYHRTRGDMSGWRLLEEVAGGYCYTIPANKMAMSGYGPTWRAYRHPPTGEERTRC